MSRVGQTPSNLSRQEVGFFDTTKTGEITSRLTQDCPLATENGPKNSRKAMLRSIGVPAKWNWCNLGGRGGFKYFLIFFISPLPGEMNQFDLYFSDGLNPPTSNVFWFQIFVFNNCHHWANTETLYPTFFSKKQLIWDFGKLTCQRSMEGWINEDAFPIFWKMKSHHLWFTWNDRPQSQYRILTDVQFIKGNWDH